MGSLHGFQIDSDRGLSRLSEADGPLGTIQVRQAAGSLLTDPAEITQIVVAADCAPNHLRASRGTRQLTWSFDAGSYEADPEAAKVMHYEADATASHGALRWEDRLSATAIPLMLGERGGLPMHASAVRVGDAALLICALSGRGKSTLAALMAWRGHAQIAEDGVVVFEREDVPVVWPGQIGSLVTDEAMAAFGAGAGPPEPTPADRRGRRLRLIGEPVTRADTCCGGGNPDGAGRRPGRGGERRRCRRHTANCWSMSSQAGAGPAPRSPPPRAWCNGFGWRSSGCPTMWSRSPVPLMPSSRCAT